MIGQKLKELREKTGMNKKEFANYLGLKYTTYNNYETEAREPASDFLILISDKFDVSIDYLLGRKEEQNLLHSYSLKSSEYELIKKYRTLDPFGQETVTIAVDRESDRTDQIAVLKNHSFELLNAAHQNPGATSEDLQYDNDIMDDDGEWE